MEPQHSYAIVIALVLCEVPYLTTDPRMTMTHHPGISFISNDGQLVSRCHSQYVLEVLLRVTGPTGVGWVVEDNGSRIAINLALQVF